MPPLVSIIIPNYNCAPFVRQAVESALAQSYPAIEVVVIDDGSTDASAATIADLAGDSRIVLQFQANAGVAAARNAGIAAAHGEYLVFLDCDDYLHPTMVARLMDLVDQRDYRVFAYANFMRVDVAGVALPEHKPLARYRTRLEGNLLPALLIGCYLLPVSVLISRELVLEVGRFAPAYTGGDDYDLWLRVSCSGAQARYLNENLAFYRHRPGSQSADTTHQKAIERRILNDFIARHPNEIISVMPELLEEIRSSAELAWHDSTAHLRIAEQYAGSLETMLAEREGALAESHAYSASLKQILGQRDQELEQAQTYTESIEAALTETQQYAHSLAAELTKLEQHNQPQPNLADFTQPLTHPITVSIIIPCYNTATYLRQAVESALTQSYQPIEVIVVDDGSTDGSAETIADLLADPRMQLITQANQGIAIARNTGITASQGGYLVFLDSDDYLETDMVARLIEVIDPTDQRVFAYCDYIKINAQGIPFQEQRPITATRMQREGQLLPALLIGNFIQPNCVLISRALTIAAGCFDSRFICCEDYDLWLRICCYGGQARYIDAPLAYYRIHANNMSANRDRMIAATNSVIGTLCERYPAQVAQATPQAIAEVWQHYSNAWQDGSARLHSAEAYARSLETTLQERESAFRNAEAYAHSLEEELQRQQAAFTELETYTRSLIAAHHGEAEVPQ